MLIKLDYESVSLVLFPANRPLYSCLPSDLAFEWQQGWR